MPSLHFGPPVISMNLPAPTVNLVELLDPGSDFIKTVEVVRALSPIDNLVGGAPGQNSGVSVGAAVAVGVSVGAGVAVGVGSLVGVASSVGTAVSVAAAAPDPCGFSGCELAAAPFPVRILQATKLRSSVSVIVT